jgi:hypothetical protein
MDDVLHRLLDIAVELVSRLARERDVQPGVRERRVLLDGRTEELVGFLGTRDVRELLAGQKIYPGGLVGGGDRNLGDLGRRESLLLSARAPASMTDLLGDCM